VACEIGVKSFVPGDELVGEGEARHEATLLQPKDCTETSTEKDALHTSKCHKPLCKTSFTAGHTDDDVDCG
jgi:hypothetical protein